MLGRYYFFVNQHQQRNNVSVIIGLAARYNLH